jgi:hypothetical protein
MLLILHLDDRDLVMDQWEPEALQVLVVAQEANTHPQMLTTWVDK